MATTGTDTLDVASLLSVLSPRWIPEQAKRIFQQGQEAVVFALLNLAEKKAGVPTDTAPSDPPQ